MIKLLHLNHDIAFPSPTLAMVGDAGGGSLFSRRSQDKLNSTIGGSQSDCS